MFDAGHVGRWLVVAVVFGGDIHAFYIDACRVGYRV